MTTVVDRVVTEDLRVTDNGDGTLTLLVLAAGNSARSDATGRGRPARSDDYCEHLVPPRT